AAARLQDLPEILADEVLHRDEDVALGRLPEVGDVDDVLVADARGALGLLHEAAHEIGPAREIGEEDLERDLLLDDHVLGEVDEAHPPLAQLLQDAVAVRKNLAEERILAERRRRPFQSHEATNLTYRRGAARVPRRYET